MKYFVSILLTVCFILCLCPAVSAYRNPYTGEEAAAAAAAAAGENEVERVAEAVAAAASGEVYLVRLAVAATFVNDGAATGQGAAAAAEEYLARHPRRREVSDSDRRAALTALCGADPTGGARSFGRRAHGVVMRAPLLEAEGYLFW